jgi:hypothetical protein
MCFLHFSLFYIELIMFRVIHKTFSQYVVNQDLGYYVPVLC